MNRRDFLLAAGSAAGYAISCWPPAALPALRCFIQACGPLMPQEESIA